MSGQGREGRGRAGGRGRRGGGRSGFQHRRFGAPPTKTAHPRNLPALARLGDMYEEVATLDPNSNKRYCYLRGMKSLAKCTEPIRTIKDAKDLKDVGDFLAHLIVAALEEARGDDVGESDGDGDGDDVNPGHSGGNGARSGTGKVGLEEDFGVTGAGSARGGSTVASDTTRLRKGRAVEKPRAAAVAGGLNGSKDGITPRTRARKLLKKHSCEHHASSGGYFRAVMCSQDGGEGNAYDGNGDDDNESAEGGAGAAHHFFDPLSPTCVAATPRGATVNTKASAKEAAHRSALEESRRLNEECLYQRGGGDRDRRRGGGGGGDAHDEEEWGAATTSTTCHYHKWMAILLIDGREPKAEHLQAKMRMAGIDCEVRHLPIGDVTWIARGVLRPDFRRSGDGEAAAGEENGSGGATTTKTRKKKTIKKKSSTPFPPPTVEVILGTVLERKSWADLASSLFGTRYEEQRLRLRRSAAGTSQVLYLVETPSETIELTNCPPSTLRYTAMETMIHAGFGVVRTTGAEDTLRCLKMMHRRIVGRCWPEEARRARKRWRPSSAKMGTGAGGTRHDDKTASASAVTFDTPPRVLPPPLSDGDDDRSVDRTTETKTYTTYAEFKAKLELHREVGKRSVGAIHRAMLKQVSGISVRNAAAIGEVYPTPAYLLAAYDRIGTSTAFSPDPSSTPKKRRREELGKQLLENVRVVHRGRGGCGGGQRLVRVGPKKSEELWNVYNAGGDPESRGRRTISDCAPNVGKRRSAAAEEEKDEPPRAGDAGNRAAEEGSFASLPSNGTHDDVDVDDAVQCAKRRSDENISEKVADSVEYAMKNKKGRVRTECNIFASPPLSSTDDDDSTVESSKKSSGKAGIDDRFVERRKIGKHGVFAERIFFSSPLLDGTDSDDTVTAESKDEKGRSVRPPGPSSSGDETVADLSPPKTGRSLPPKSRPPPPSRASPFLRGWSPTLSLSSAFSSASESGVAARRAAAASSPRSAAGGGGGAPAIPKSLTSSVASARRSAEDSDERAFVRGLKDENCYDLTMDSEDEDGNCCSPLSSRWSERPMYEPLMVSREPSAAATDNDSIEVIELTS